jgi:LmbE family N-acetylglucosaminyl deacetylase
LDVREVRDVWLGWTNEPNHLEDVTGHFRTKMDALAAHASQVEDGIAFFKDELEREAAEAGAKIGVGHAEEFRVLALS